MTSALRANSATGYSQHVNRSNKLTVNCLCNGGCSYRQQPLLAKLFAFSVNRHRQEITVYSQLTHSIAQTCPHASGIKI